MAIGARTTQKEEQLLTEFLVVSFLLLQSNTLDSQLRKKRGLVWLTVLEILICGGLAH